jgi:hypothetical protein
MRWLVLRRLANLALGANNLTQLIMILLIQAFSLPGIPRFQGLASRIYCSCSRPVMARCRRPPHRSIVAAYWGQPAMPVVPADGAV